MDTPAPRTDLLELTPEALTALANAGFVKRAHKDLAAGLLPRLEQAGDGAVTAHFDDGARTQLPPGRSLRDAACTCPASGMCRHRVMLVLAYQAQYQRTAAGAPPAPAPGAPPAPAPAPAGPDAATAAARPPQAPPASEAAADAWSPACFDDAALAAGMAPGVLQQAQRLAAERPVIAVQAGQAGQPPSARLPMCSVRFFSRSALAHARCDCREGGGCAHVVLAVWAFRDVGALALDGREHMVEVAPRAVAAAAAGTSAPEAGAGAASGRLLQAEAARAAQAQIEALVQALWLDGASQPPAALDARLAAARAQVQALGWCWIGDALDELQLLLQALHARSSRFDAQRLLAVVAELWARLRAAAHADAPSEAGSDAGRPALRASQILGLGVKGEVALDHLRLVSLGAVLWSDEAGEGADVLLADPDTQTVTVLERHWPRAADAAAGGAPAQLTGRRVAGFPLRQVAAGQVITKTATRRANGRIDIRAGARQTGVMPLSPQAWDELGPPLRPRSVRALIAQLQTARPDFVQPRQAASGAATGTGGALHVLALSGRRVAHCHWDAAAQVLHACLESGTAGEAVDGDAAASVDAAAAAAAGAPADASPPASPGEDADLPLYLALPHRAAAPGAVDALACALALEWGELRAVAGTVRLQGGRALMQPLALLTAQRAVVLQVEDAAPQPLALHGGHEPQSTLGQLAGETLALLATWLRQGLRHQGAAAASRADEQAQSLRLAGLQRCAGLLQAARAGLRGADRSALPGQLATLSLLLRGVGQ